MPTNSISRPALFAILLTIVSAHLASAEETVPFRTDDSQDKTLPWFELVDGQFPPPHSGHAISGELIESDHLERAFQIRVDRDDSQQKGKQDLPLAARMLPYGSIYYAGGTAALKDIPLGTHLHGVFYVKDRNDKKAPAVGGNGKTSGEAEFRRCIRLEDDFSYYARQNLLWKVSAIDPDAKTLTASLFDGTQSVGDAQTFQLTE